MSLSNSKIVPAAFWVGFLALGFATSLSGSSKLTGPSKHRVEAAARPAKTGVDRQAIIAQTEKPAASRTQAPAQAND